MGNPAEYKIRKSYLSDDFGYELAVKWFGQEVVDDLPKYTKGKHEGKPMGLVKWIKVEKGGYDPMHYSTSGRLETRKGFILGKALLKLLGVLSGLILTMVLKLKIVIKSLHHLILWLQKREKPHLSYGVNK